jgi:chemotaxis protein MotB
MDEKNQPIVIKRVKKIVQGHHGGGWKVAFADFMTAMFAVFLILWLVTAMDETKRHGIADYFRNPSQMQGPAGQVSAVDLQGGSDTPLALGDVPNRPSLEIMDDFAQEMDMKQLEALQQVLEEAISRSQALAPFKDQLLLDISPEGLRIQLVDQENRPMFDLGSARLRDYAERILLQLAEPLNSVPNKISIAGHTDATPFVARRADYGNWELSSDRALAARRALIAGGMQPERVAQVTGLSSTVLFDKENPFNPINRRISIIVLNRIAEEAISRRESKTADYP